MSGLNANAERIRNEVRAEAMENEERRKHANQFSGTYNGHPMPPKHYSNDIQRVTVSKDPTWLRNGIYVNWPDHWNQLCDRAAVAGKRPIPFLIDIIEDFLGAEDEAG